MIIGNSSVYCGILKTFNKFTGADMSCEYITDDDFCDYLVEKYNLDRISGSGDDFSKSLNVMKWLFSILRHDPDYHNNSNDNADNLLEHLNNGGSINCRATAVILTECLLALGIPARTVWLMPMNPYDEDCHVISMAYCKEMGKWVTFDATVNSIVMDEKGHPLDPIEIRTVLENMGTLKFSNELLYYRVKCSHEAQCKGYYSYLAKNMFYFKSYKINCFKYESIAYNIIFCIPDGFDYDNQNHIIQSVCANEIDVSKAVEKYTLKSFCEPIQTMSD